jgi:hypothetical protein
LAPSPSQGRCGDDAAHGSGPPVAHAGRAGHDGRTTDPHEPRPRPSSDAGGAGEDRSRLPESPLGGNADGRSDRVDAPELHTTVDSRTDELRLLGNGVVPAVAALAFLTLWRELTATK